MSGLSKQQFYKLMKRPTMSEYNDSVARNNKRTEKSLEHQYGLMDKLAKVQISDHNKKWKDFVDTQIIKTTRSVDIRRNSDGGQNISDSFQKLSILDPQSRRGSLPVTMPSQLNNNQSSQPKHAQRRVSLPAQRRRMSSIWEDLSSSKNSNRTVEIRRKLYDEFKVSTAKPRRRPWSPIEEDVSTASSSPVIIETRRRQSEPALNLTDKLSDDMRDKLNAILSSMTVHSSSPEQLTHNPENRRHSVIPASSEHLGQIKLPALSKSDSLVNTIQEI